MTMHILLFVVNDRFGIVSHPLSQTQDSETDRPLRRMKRSGKGLRRKTDEQIFEMRATKTRAGALISALLTFARASERDILCCGES